MRLTLFTSSILLFIVFQSGACDSIIYSKSGVPQNAVFQIPQTDFSMTLERYHAHLFLAEYQRMLVLHRRQNEILRKEVSFDTGGYSRMNIYRLTSTKYCFQDFSGLWELDVHNFAIVDKSIEATNKGEFIGAFDIDGSKTWRFISSNERAEKNFNE